MKRRLVILLLLFSGYSTVFAQITIDDCYRKARINYPLIKQYDLIEKTREYNLSNANKGYLPQLLLSAKVSYQSDVTRIPINIPGVEGLSKDQYGLTLELNQSVWDGGEIKSRKEGIHTASEIERQNLEVNLYAIRDRINQLYFGILLMDARIEQNDVYQNDLKRNYDKVEAYVQNGVAHKADLDAVKVEQLKVQQNRILFLHARTAYMDMLSAFIGEKLKDGVTLVKPELSSPVSVSIDRPELALYEAQTRNYETRKKEIKAGLMPKVGLFATGGYGKPSLNMLSNDLQLYGVGGIRISWNINNLYSNKNSKRLVETGIHTIEVQRATFLFNTQLDVFQKENNIASYREQLKYDDEIIELRNSIKRSSEVKMANGTISGIDMVRDINAENTAVLDKIQHEIEMYLAIYNLKFTTNH